MSFAISSIRFFVLPTTELYNSLTSQNCFETGFAHDADFGAALDFFFGSGGATAGGPVYSLPPYYPSLVWFSTLV